VNATSDQPLEIVPAAAQRGPLVLEADHLVKQFRLSRGPRGEVLSAARDVSFGLYRSAVVALVGESGSGKSTVARMLAGQEQPTAGRILLDGSEIMPWKRRSFRTYKRDVQMVFQDPFASLNPVHTVRYVLGRAVRLNDGAMNGGAVSAESVRLLSGVRLTPAEQFLVKYPHELSGGQRQRVAIARALAAHPRVLLADEPVSMLDVSIRLEVLDLIDELRSQFDLAVLYVTHDIASARYFADETLVMYAGEIVERGPSEALTQQPAHPYTQLLVSSSPDPGNLRRIARPASPAAPRRVGSALASVTGCRFVDRCPLAEPRCHAQSPPLMFVGAQRAAACWRLDVAAPRLVPERGENRSAAMKS
jgi:peptide/nickel transport system ATP-binding protein